MSATDFRRKEEDRLEKMQETAEKQEMVEQQLLDEETAEFGYLEDSEEMDDYRKLNYLSSLFAFRSWVMSYVHGTSFGR
jgi:hypothetical protein